MPSKRFTHECGHGYRFAEACRECGEGGVYDGWDGVMVDKMAAYARRFGLKPIGSHRSLADEMFKGTEVTCARCGGRGYLAVDDQHCQPCQDCQASGTVVVIAPEEFEALRNRVLRAFPDAVNRPVSIVGPFVQDHATGEILSAARPE